MCQWLLPSPHRQTFLKIYFNDAVRSLYLKLWSYFDWLYQIRPGLQYRWGKHFAVWERGKFYFALIQMTILRFRPSSWKERTVFLSASFSARREDHFQTRICASLGLRMKFKTICYPVLGRNKNTSPSIILISNYFVSFQCFHNMSKQLLAPGGWLSWVRVCSSYYYVTIRPWGLPARSWICRIWVPLGPQMLQTVLICFWLCNCGTEGLIWFCWF